MHPKKIWANYGVADLDRATKFYTDLGFKSNGASNELTSFLFGDDEFVIHFFLKDILQSNVKINLNDSNKSNEIIFTISAESRAEVDSWEREVEKAGGKIISRAEEFGKGYYGFVFSDPDGHTFNVFHM